MANNRSRLRDDDDDEGHEGEKECPFCHEFIDIASIDRHVKKHTKRQADGQMESHVTLREKDRHTGSLCGVPRVYKHKKCRGKTEMPEDIIRSYLQDPFLYNDGTFCCGCNDYVPMKECTWTETGQNVREYMLDLQADAIEDGRVTPNANSLTGWLLIFGGIAFVMGGAVGGWKFGLTGGIIGAVIGLVAGLALGFNLHRQEKEKYDKAKRRLKQRRKE